MTDNSSEEQLKRMVMTFRVSELQMLLGYAGKNKTGRKNELQSRALDIVRIRNESIHRKIRELYKSIQLEMMSFSDRSQAAAGGATANILSNQRVPSALNPSLATGYSQAGNIGVNTSGYNSRSSSQISNLGTNVGYTSIQPSHNNSYPLSPDVRLKKLPFFDVLGELLKPSTLAPQGSGRYQEAAFTFCLTPQQANKIAHSRDLRPGRQDYTVQVQMRFCLLETTSEQEDNFPPNITVKVNDKMCPLPSPIPTNKAGVEPKRPSRPVNMTALCKISPTVTNRIHVSWSSEYGRCYVISVYLVKKLTSEDLLQRLKTKGPRLADFTKSLIKQKLREDGECEIATTSLRCSLLCPLGKMRMMLPCRAETCIHLQCFDASLFLLMNERKPTWTCPVCDKAALYDNLVIDGYFQDVLQVDSECTEVTLQKDGGWTPLVVKKEPKEQQQRERKSEVAIETLSDDSDEGTNNNDNDDSVIEVSKKRKKDSDVEIISLCDSDDEPETEPPSKRQAGVAASGSGLLSNDASATNGGNRAESTGTDVGSEGTKSNDSWCVGEFDPGKRLIFRKSMPSTTTNGGEGSGSSNGVPPPVVSPRSNGTSSPQIICLDSPVASPHPPSCQVDTDGLAPATNSGLSTQSSSSVLHATDAGSMNVNSALATLSAFGSELTPVEGDATDPLNSPNSHSSQYSSENLSSGASIGNSYNLLQDPLGASSLNLIPLPSPNSTSYAMNSGMSNLFNPMLDPNISPPPNPNINFRPQDRFF